MSPFDSEYAWIDPAHAVDRTRGRIGLGDARPADLFDAWVFAETDAQLALGAWRAAPRDEKPAAHAGYLAALEREAHAALMFERRVLRERAAR